VGNLRENNIDVARITNENLEDLLINDMVVEGGHYSAGESIGSVAAWTWDRAAELYSHALSCGLEGLGLMLLIDDFAIETPRRAEFRANYDIPQQYRASLDRYGIDSSAVIIVWEVQLRNHSRGDMRRRLKPRVVLEDDGYFVDCHDGTHRQITFGTTPICNLIMARHTSDKDRLFKYALNLYDMKWECPSKGGVVVSRALYDTSITVFNVYISLAQQIAFMGVHEGLEIHGQG
jgi:hypothetical protein